MCKNRITVYFCSLPLTKKRLGVMCSESISTLGKLVNISRIYATFGMLVQCSANWATPSGSSKMWYLETEFSSCINVNVIIILTVSWWEPGLKGRQKRRRRKEFISLADLITSMTMTFISFHCATTEMTHRI